ncbi:alcohol dehydrogenase catalytic domain-containing protein [Streptomyces sp. DSM 44917]|uniref:2-deoxy-scyllo-inosamine dehydrogenase n=1 Tax=Streptomyces boetiae TaxID=3075541 RepID=A0ABU2L508_9ACTN|nr:alcohol dehydrogenase catalytic domain-containing protein [Streptomyces sp. DSM 44917]MDT0306615.1 alcohol dehydrogenase catalytic domain-containing protein [Streptomyces sp. DSM 44917]
MPLMSAARAHRGTADFTLEKTEIPEPGPGEVLIKVAAAGLAPSIPKLLALGAFRHLPTTPGHEIAGTVTAVGPDADEALTGRRVRVHPTLSCRACRFCRTDREQLCAESAMIGHAAFGKGELKLYARYHDGGLAEYVRVPAWLVDELPDNVSFEVGAKVHDLGNAVRALKCAALPAAGSLIVTAATGTMGVATVKLARHFGAGRLVLVGRSAERLEAVRALAGPVPAETVALEELGEDWGTDGALTGRLRALLPEGADAAIDYLPAGPGSGQTAAAVGAAGTFVHMGGNGAPFPLSLRDLMHDCLRIVGTRNCTRADTAAVLGLLASGQLTAEELITHRYPLTEVNAAVAAMLGRTEPIWMAVVHP